MSKEADHTTTVIIWTGDKPPLNAEDGDYWRDADGAWWFQRLGEWIPSNPPDDGRSEM